MSTHPLHPARGARDRAPPGLAKPERALAVLNGVSFLRSLHFFGAISVPFFQDWVGLDYSRIFLLQAWFAFWLFLLEIPTGVVADRRGKRFSMLLSGAFMVVGQSVYGIGRSYPALLLAEFLLAVGLALNSGADVALVFDSARRAGRDTRRALVRYRTWGTAGLVIGFISGAQLADSNLLPYPRALPLTFLLAAVGQLLGTLLLRATPEPERVVAPAQGALRHGWNGLRSVFAEPALRGYAFNAVAINATTFFIFWFYQPVLQGLGVAVRWNGLVAAGFNLLALLVLARLPWLEARLGVLRLVAFTAFLPGLLYLALPFLTHPAAAVPVILLIGGCRIGRDPLLQDLLNRHVTSDRRATVLSAVSMLSRIGIFVLYPILGWLADHSLPLTLLSLAGLTLAGATATHLRTEAPVEVTDAGPAGEALPQAAPATD